MQTQKDEIAAENSSYLERIDTLEHHLKEKESEVGELKAQIDNVNGSGEQNVCYEELEKEVATLKREIAVQSGEYDNKLKTKGKIIQLQTRPIFLHLRFVEEAIQFLSDL